MADGGPWTASIPGIAPAQVVDALRPAFFLVIVAGAVVTMSCRVAARDPPHFVFRPASPTVALATASKLVLA
jgi:hypothetical protein